MNILKLIACLLLVALFAAPALANGVTVQRQVVRQREGLLGRLFGQRQQVQKQVFVEQRAPLVQKQVFVEQQYVPQQQQVFVQKQYVPQQEQIIIERQYVVPQKQIQKQKFLQQQGGCYQGQCGGQVLQQRSYGIW